MRFGVDQLTWWMAEGWHIQVLLAGGLEKLELGLLLCDHRSSVSCSEASLFFGLPAVPLDMVLDLPNPPVFTVPNLLLASHAPSPSPPRQYSSHFSLSCFVMPFVPSPMFINLLYVVAKAPSHFFVLVLCEPTHQSRSLEPAVLLSCGSGAEFKHSQ